MVRAIFFDVDGTLVSFNTHKTTEALRNALKELRRKGIKLFLSTGRSPMWIDMLEGLTEFKFDGYIMTNGQYCLYNGEIIHKKEFSISSLEGIIDYMREKNISCEFVEKDKMYLNLLNQKVMDLREKLGSTSPFSKVEDTDRIYENSILQLCPYIDEAEDEEFLKHIPGYKSVRWTNIITDIIPENGGKDVGIREVLKYLNIDKSECMAFGDGGNDIDMLRFVGIGVAMGNSADKVKEHADFVTKSVDEDGVIYALKKFGVL